MSAVLRTRGRLASLFVALVAVLAIAPAAQADNSNAGPNVVPPKAFYLALGDSLAYGYQQAKFNAEYPNIDPTTFNTGYADDFFAAMSKLSNGQQTLVNDGCPGETSASLINGGPAPGTCGSASPFPYVWLHHPYTGGSQLNDALAFLRANPKKVSPITINIGANDLLATERACAAANGGSTTSLGFLQCVQTQAPITIGNVANNLGIILAAVRNAAPTSEIIVMGLYNPQFTLPGGDQLIEGGFNPAMAQVASQFGAFFADPFPTINQNIATYGSEAGSVCSQIAICTPLQDIHPFDNGYQAIANVIFQASGYANLK